MSHFSLLAVQAVLGAAAGLAGGLLFFRALRRNAALYVMAGAPLWKPVALHLVRQGGIAALLVGAVLAGGAPALLGTLGGILAARRLVGPQPGAAAP